MGRPITFVTPSFADDYDWFVFQRESMARCGIDVQHIVVVNTEDVELFRNMPFGEDLIVVSTLDVLPYEIEIRRREGAISGWWVQQVVKLGAAEIVDNDYVCVDSDVFWVRPVTAADFYAPTGELYLFEYRGITSEILGWLSASLRLWGVGPQHPVVPVSYVCQTPPLSMRLVRELLGAIEDRSGTSWQDALLDHGGVEYTMYGVYARYIRGLEGLLPFEADYCIACYEGELEWFRAHFPEEVAGRGAKAGMVHTRTPLAPDDVRAAVERAWEAV